ncbi:FKBP-type peptidyl-prolyl cis-trans isomerase [Hymenobacter sp. UYAg731]
MNNPLLRAHHWVLAACLLLAAPALWSCNSQTTYQKQLAEHQNQLKAIDEDTIHKYLDKHNLLKKAHRTNSGLYVVDSVAGTGTPITTGKQVRVKYIGRFLSTGAHPASTGYPASYGNPGILQGTVFDNSSENHTKCGCLVFTVGSASNVPGFNEGLLLMRQGDRKLLLLPSYLAYGSTSSATIPADAALMFDVEILEVL